MAHGDWVHLDFNFGVAVSANSEVASGSVRIMDRSLGKLKGRSHSQVSCYIFSHSFSFSILPIFL